MIRTLLLVLVAGDLLGRASEVINAPVGGVSASVTQPHVTAELIPERTNIQPGEPFDVALHLHSDKGWHTYWINPGDAGLATLIKWTLPPGFTAGPIQWPTPEKHNMGPLVTYGYEGDVYLLTTITPPKGDLPFHFDVKAHAEWLVCQEECIPGKADLALKLDAGLALLLPIENKDFFAEARGRLPVGNAPWDVKASYGSGVNFKTSPVPEALNLELRRKSGVVLNIIKNHYRFFPEQSNVLGNQDVDQSATFFKPNETDALSVALQQNGEKPDKLSGVLVADQPLIGTVKAVYLSEFFVASKVAAAVPSGGLVSQSNGNATAPPLGTAAATNGGGIDDGSFGSAQDRRRPPLQTAAAPPLGTAAATSETAIAQPWLIAVLGAAFIGGLILNLMPCVLPVLSLKVFSLMRHAGENPRGAWRQGVAFTAGVVLSFWVLAGLLLALRAAGDQIGWGFQMQSPGFVLALIFLFFLLGLNLFGVFELGSSLVGLDAKATGRFHGLTSSFLNGALATVAATPCTAPFMGSALGFAAQQPAVISLLVFTFLALGMATPYLLLTIFPGALRFVPKPGAWMEALKQLMGFLLMATVIFLVYVFGALQGEKSEIPVLIDLLFAAIVMWYYGRKQRAGMSLYAHICWGIIFGLLTLIFFSTEAFSVPSDGKGTAVEPTAATTEGDWQVWSPEAVAAELAKGRPVFVDFTATWCLSCKVNERIALESDAVRKAFAEKNVALFRADWTHSDARISETLRRFNRDGVPLYLVYSPREKGKPRVLPEVLTPGIVLEALNF